MKLALIIRMARELLERASADELAQLRDLITQVLEGRG